MKNNNIKYIYDRLCEEKDLEPGLRVNRLFTNLVNLVMADKISPGTLSAEEKKHLQNMCSCAEFNLELHWANKIINSDDSWQTLQSFVYYQNYVDLTKLEYRSLNSRLKQTSDHYLFCGGGPLPLTAILLAKHYGKKITIIDNQPIAVSKSRKLIKKLGLNNQIKIELKDACLFDKFNKYKVIFVAALAGVDSKNKEKIFNNIREQCSADCHILGRSSWGSRELLYQPIDEQILKCFRKILEVRPKQKIINSIIILGKQLK